LNRLDASTYPTSKYRTPRGMDRRSAFPYALPPVLLYRIARSHEQVRTVAELPYWTKIDNGFTVCHQSPEFGEEALSIPTAGAKSPVPAQDSQALDKEGRSGNLGRPFHEINLCLHVPAPTARSSLATDRPVRIRVLRVRALQPGALQKLIEKYEPIAEFDGVAAVDGQESAQLGGWVLRAWPSHRS